MSTKLKRHEGMFVDLYSHMQGGLSTWMLITQEAARSNHIIFGENELQDLLAGNLGGASKAVVDEKAIGDLAVKLISTSSLREIRSKLAVMPVTEKRVFARVYMRMIQSSIRGVARMQH